MCSADLCSLLRFFACEPSKRRDAAKTASSFEASRGNWLALFHSLSYAKDTFSLASFLGSAKFQSCLLTSRTIFQNPSLTEQLIPFSLKHCLTNFALSVKFVNFRITGLLPLALGLPSLCILSMHTGSLLRTFLRISSFTKDCSALLSLLSLSGICKLRDFTYLSGFQGHWH